MTRFAYLGAPAFMFGYGVTRLIDGLDGSHGPGPAWTLGHLMFLVALLLYGVVAVGLRAEVARLRPLATVAAVLAGLGVLVFVRTVVVDLIVGLRAADRPGMNRLYPEYDTFPGGLPKTFVAVLTAVGPALLVVGLLILAVQLAVLAPRPLRWWSPVLLLLGFTVIPVNLDLLPLAAVLLLTALLPMARISGRFPAVA